VMRGMASIARTTVKVAPRAPNCCCGAILESVGCERGWFLKKFCIKRFVGLLERTVNNQVDDN